jgi:hypothetical protein
MKKKFSPEELARLRAIFAIRRLAPKMQSELLGNLALIARTGIEVSSPIRLPGGSPVIDRNVLFEAFQKAIDEEPAVQITDNVGMPFNCTIEVENESVTVAFDDKRVLFVNAVLLTAKPDRRKATGSVLLSRHTLTRQNKGEFERLIGKTDFTHADFFAATSLLAGSPESFGDELLQQAQTGNLSTQEFVPESPAYWDNLIATRQTSETLNSFLAYELNEERNDRLARDPIAAVETIAASFAAPVLLPNSLFATVADDVMIAGTNNLLQHPDPFGLTGAFDICATRAPLDPRFVSLGDAILERLIADPERLRSECVTYATAFVLATAFLAEHQTLRQQPVFWRRLAAAAHAALVTRILGAASESENSFLSWAMRMKGRTFYLSVLNDALIEPRWKPDWIEPRLLAADVYGRVFASLSRMPLESRPDSWSGKISAAHRALFEGKSNLESMYPALMEGARRIDKPKPPEPVADLYAKFREDPSVENFVMLTPVVYLFGSEADGNDAILEVLNKLRTEAQPIQPRLAELVMSLAAYIAAQQRNTKLADTVSQIAIERLAGVGDDEGVMHTVATLLECGAATEDREAAIASLAKRLETLAFVAPAAKLAEVSSLLRMLQGINEPLGFQLGRAIATANLGIPRIRAA